MKPFIAHLRVTNTAVREVPWEWAGLVVSIAAALTVISLMTTRLFKKRQVKKKYPALKGALECYLMEVPTGTKAIPIQSWSATFLAAHPHISLDQLLKHISLRSKMPEARKVVVSVNEDSTFLITNQAGVECFKDGKTVTDPHITLHSGEGLYLVFQKNTLEIELRVRPTTN